MPKTPSGRRRDPASRPAISSPWPGNGRARRTTLASRRPLRHGACHARRRTATSGRACMVLLMGMQGLGKPGVNYVLHHRRGAGRLDFYFPGYADGGISRRQRGSAGTGPPRLSQTADQRARSVSAINRSFFPNASSSPRSAGAGCTATMARARSSSSSRMHLPVPRLFGNQDDIPAGGFVHRHHDEHQPLCPDVPAIRTSSSSSTRPSSSEPEARFADIVFPVCTNFERWDIGEWAKISGYSNQYGPTNARVVVFQQKCIEPSASPNRTIRLCAARRTARYQGAVHRGAPR